MNPVPSEATIDEEDQDFTPEVLASIIYDLMQLDNESDVFVQLKLPTAEIEELFEMRVTESFVQYASTFLSGAGVSISYVYGEEDIISACTDSDFNLVFTGKTTDAAPVVTPIDGTYWWGSIPYDIAEDATVNVTVLVAGDPKAVADFVSVLENGDAGDSDEDPDGYDEDDLD